MLDLHAKKVNARKCFFIVIKMAVMGCRYTTSNSNYTKQHADTTLT